MNAFVTAGVHGRRHVVIESTAEHGPISISQARPTNEEFTLAY